VSFDESSRRALLPFSEKEHLIQGDRNITLHAYDWGGTGPTLMMAHATGLHAHAWLPLVKHLRASFHCIGVDLLGQGASSVPDDGDLGWHGVSETLALVLDHFDLSGRGDVYGIGHSQGGYAVLAAELLRPGTFASLFVYEPVVFPLQPGAKPGDPWADNPMATITLRRRPTFASAEQAIANFSAKPPFGQCDADVVRSYVHWGFRETGVVIDGEREITLVCPPEVEASLFAYSRTNIFDDLTHINCPIVFGLGSVPGNFSEVVTQAAARAKHGTLLEFPGRTHFGILEGVEEMATVVCETLLGIE
jgi:pimeloyl-ACP methyl ester carboxylesterase